MRLSTSIAVEPAIARFISSLPGDIGPDSGLSPSQRRDAMQAGYAARMSELTWPDAWRADVAVHELSATALGRTVPVRVFVPIHSHDLIPVYVYFFGGGWWQRTFDAPDIIHSCGQTALDGNVIVVEVDYGLAPERPFPHGLEDGYTVLTWITRQRQFPMDGARVAVGGNSAGANLAAALCLVSRDRHGPAIQAQILEVPLLDVGERQGEAIDFYLQGDVSADHPYVSPLRAPTHAGVPRALILTAEHDPLSNDGRAYGNALRSAGVEAVTVTYDGQVHLTPSLGPLSASARAWRRQINAELRCLSAP